MKKATKEPLSTWKEAELLAAVAWGNASVENVAMARVVIEQAHGLRLLAMMSEYSIWCLPGITRNNAARICAALELGKRAATYTPRTRVQTSADVVAWAMGQFGHLEYEELWILCLDGRNAILGARKVAQGTAHNTGVSAPIILRAALLEGATSIILIHNHPSGDARPSASDVSSTRLICDAARAVGIPVADHVIVGPSGEYSSLLDLGLIPSVNEEK